MKIKCDRCNKVLKRQGALVFSPPSDIHTCSKKSVSDRKCKVWAIDGNNVIKFHLCRTCYSEFCDWLEALLGGVNND